MADGFHWAEFLLGICLSALCIAVYVGQVGWASRRKRSRRENVEAIQMVQDFNISKLKRLLGQRGLPSWINFPDFERVEWLNAALAQLWPYVDRAVSQLARETLNPLMQEQKPSWMNSIAVDRFTLGTLPPIFTGVKLYRGGGSVADEIIMEVDFMWGGNQDISLAIKPLPGFLHAALSDYITIKVGVDDFILNGRLRMVLKPLLDTMPIIGAMQFAFTEVPYFSFDLRLLGGELTSLPFLEAWLVGFIRTLLDPYTLPDRYTYPLVEGIMDADSFERPVGMLTVKLMEAENIPSHDWFSKSDPYVEFFVRPGRKLQSTIITNESAPVWGTGETFQFLVHIPDSQVLTAIMYDYDVFTKDDEIGRVQIPIMEITGGEMKSIWLELDPPESEKRKEEKRRQRAGQAFKADANGSTKKSRRRIAKNALFSPAARPQMRLQLQYTAFERDFVDNVIEDGKNGGAGGVAGSQPEALQEAAKFLQGGVLYVKVSKLSNLIKTAWYKGGYATQTTVVVTVGGQQKLTAPVSSRGSKFELQVNQTLEFLLDGETAQKASEQIEIHVKDKAGLLLNLAQSVKGNVRVPLSDVVTSKRIANDFPLKGVQHGAISLDISWLGALAAA